MSGDFETEQKRYLDDEKFEESLVSDIDSELINAETEIISKPKPTPEKTKGEKKEKEKKKAPSWVGKRFGRFKLLRLIGEGKMGRVIQAEDINLHRIVALKVLNKRIPGVDEQQRVLQFLREARAAAKLEHPNVVRIYEINQHDGWWYIAMEFLEAGNLKDIVKAAGPLPAIRASALIADAGSALAAAHQLGIIHRDIKPTNLMLNRAGRCKVTDFGLVRVNDPNDPFDFTDKAVGSPQFMAPEMIQNAEQTPAIDIYSLGATLYYALTAKAPYTAKTLNEILQKHLKAPIPDVRDFHSRCPSSLADLIKTMMAKKPEDRPTALGVAGCLRAETIGWQGEDSEILSGTSSSLLAHSYEQRMGSSTLKPVKVKRKVLSRPVLVILSVAVAAVIGFFIVTRYGYVTSPGPAEATNYSELFANTPASYGMRPADTTLKAILPRPGEPPAFSWKGKVETAGMRYVASENGRYFYPIDSPEALLIREDLFVGYESQAEAIADGKTRAK